MVEYSVVWNKFRSEATQDIKDIKELVKDISYLKKGIICTIEERTVDGTMGVVWTLSTETLHFRAYGVDIYCIEGTVIVGYTEVNEYLITNLGFAKDEANEFVLCLLLG